MTEGPHPEPRSEAQTDSSGDHLEKASLPGMLSHVHAVELTAYSGPIPPPDLLRQFDQVYPGAAKQILEDFVQESAHRRTMERKIVSTESFKSIFGATVAGLIGMTGVGGGIWLAHEGRSTGGLSAIFATLASLVGVYLYQTRRADAEARRDRPGSEGDPR